MKPNTCTNLLLAVLLVVSTFVTSVSAQVSDKEMKSISTPDSVETPIGKLEFFDGVPTEKTVQIVYDNLDRMRGVAVFLNCLPAASRYRLHAVNERAGVDTSSKIAIFEQLMGSESIYLTANTYTLYAFSFLDLKTDGPTVIELPPGMLGALNDAWFRYIGDFGAAGPDKGKGGKYLVLPPGYKEGVPDGYFIMPPNAPVKDFWAITLYDTQIRSQLQTSQPFPTVGSKSKGFQKNADGSYDVYFGPKPPQGKEHNWLETIPGMSWFTILRMYGPLEPWINKTWRPGEIEEINL